MRLHLFIIIHECWKERHHSFQWCSHREVAYNPIIIDLLMLMQTVPINSVSHTPRKDMGIEGGLARKKKGFTVDGVTEDNECLRVIVCMMCKTTKEYFLKATQ